MVFWSVEMRTLPLYVIALLAFLNFDYNGAHSLFYHPEYWLFLQNFAWPIPNDFFTLSWSLAVEEHFYLWFPLVFFILHRFINKKISFGLLSLYYWQQLYLIELSITSLYGFQYVELEFTYGCIGKTDLHYVWCFNGLFILLS